MTSLPRRILTIFALAITFTLGAAPKDPRAVLLGTWTGTSICTAARAACRDETVVYHVTPGPKADVVSIAANKIVEGQELEMGTIDFKIDFAAHRIVGEFDNGRVASRWTFTFTATKLEGIAVLLPDGTKIRDIKLHR
jgi:hypothetical protein